jgi:hypothetical protein
MVTYSFKIPQKEVERGGVKCRGMASREKEQLSLRILKEWNPSSAIYMSYQQS